MMCVFSHAIVQLTSYLLELCGVFLSLLPFLTYGFPTILFVSYKEMDVWNCYRQKIFYTRLQFIYAPNGVHDIKAPFWFGCSTSWRCNVIFWKKLCTDLWTIKGRECYNIGFDCTYIDGAAVYHMLADAARTALEKWLQLLESHHHIWNIFLANPWELFTNKG